MKVKVVKLDKDKLKPIRIKQVYDREDVKDGSGNVMFSYRKGVRWTVEANGSDIERFNWIFNKISRRFQRVKWVE